MAKMTLERASELVSALRELCPPPDTKAPELFDYFVEVLSISDDKLEEFAALCGFQVVTNVELTFVPWAEMGDWFDCLPEEGTQR